MNIFLACMLLSLSLVVLAGPDFPKYKGSNRECYKCPPGYCVAGDSDRSLNCPYADGVITFPSCIECSIGYYSSGWTSRQYCLQKDLCNKDYEIVYHDGGQTNNTICACLPGYQYSKNNELCQPISEILTIPSQCPPCPAPTKTTTTSIMTSCKACPECPVMQREIIACKETKAQILTIMLVISVLFNLITMSYICRRKIKSLFCYIGCKKSRNGLNYSEDETKNAETAVLVVDTGDDSQSKNTATHIDKGTQTYDTIQGRSDDDTTVTGTHEEMGTKPFAPYSDAVIDQQESTRNIEKSSGSNVKESNDITNAFGTKTMENDNNLKKLNIDEETDKSQKNLKSNPLSEQKKRSKQEKDRELLKEACKFLESKITYDNFKRFFRELDLKKNVIEDIMRLEKELENMSMKAFEKWQKLGSDKANLANLKESLYYIEAVTTWEELCNKLGIDK